MATATLPSDTIAGLAALIRRRQVSPVEITRMVLDRIAAVDRRLNSFITVCADEAIQAARAAASEIARGRYRGPLHGVPVSVKDLMAMRGHRLTGGSKILADHVPDFDATVVARLREAGTVIVGKTNLHEFAYGVTNNNVHYGPVRNPWDTSRIPGGSSGGSAVAVAAGLGAGTLGSDTGGSVRIPAALCGLVGLKVTYGRVSRHGVLPLSWSLDTVGPLAWTAEDAAILLRAIAGADPRDPSSSDAPVPDYQGGLRGGIRGLRVGRPRQYMFDLVDSEVAAAVEEAIGVLRSLGAEVEEVSTPWLDDAISAAAAIVHAEAAAYHLAWLRTRPQDYGDEVRERLLVGTSLPAVAYVQAQRTRSLLIAQMEVVWRAVDVLVAPTTPAPAARIGDATVPVNGREMDVRTTFIRCTYPVNFLGLPSISVPCGFTRAGLPVAFQIIGRPFAEDVLLRAAHAYQQQTDWHVRRPPLA
ncbi:MAG: aspartyl/glutamyl-tRNA amidotransferase subunit A [Armatimonadetes bacterium]|nr:aspartyl/glutamyl-tRNA amidotransferase subunit A [Armatimonadota bacterium]